MIRKNILIFFTVFLLFIVAYPFISKQPDLNYTYQNGNQSPKFSVSLEGAENILVTRLDRWGNISGYGLVSIEDKLSIKNLNNNPITSIFIGIPLNHSDDLIFFETTGLEGNTLLTERSYMIQSDFEMLAIYFDSPLLPYQSKTIKFTHIYKNLVSYSFIDKQYIEFNGYVYPFLPYKMESDLTTTYLVPRISEIETGDWGEVYPDRYFVRYFFDELRDDLGIEYISPFQENLGDKKDITIVFTNDDYTKMEVNEINREFYISPWGIIRVKEDFLMQNLGIMDINTFLLNIPRAARDIYVYDDLGEILGTRIIKSSTHKELTINLVTNRVKLTPNSSFRFKLRYYLPFEKYISFNWFQESVQINILSTSFEYLGRQQTVKLTIDGCYSIDSITKPPESIQKSHGATIIVYKFNYVAPIEENLIQFTFTIDIFDILLRPITFILIISLIATFYVLIIKLRKREYDLVEIKKELLLVNEIREFCSLYEEKNAQFLEIKQAEDDAKRKKMAKKNYKNILEKNTAKIEEIQKEIAPFKKVLMETNETFKSIIKKLDILEAERISVKDSLNLLETRYKRGRLPSRAAYLKLSDDFKKRGKKIDRNIDKFIQQLRSYLL